MKSLLFTKSLIASAIIALPFFARAQQGKNEFKVNLSSFVTKGFGLQYERQIGKKFTIALGYSMIPEGKIAFQSVIEDLVDDPDIKVGDFRLGTSIITPELRWYVGKKGAFHGFYLAPYGRFSTYTLQIPVSFNSAIDKRTALFDGKLKNSLGGLMLGSNFKLGKRLTLDWWILGAGIGSASGSLIAATPLNALEQKNLKDELDSIDVPFTTIESTVNSNGAIVKTTGSMAGIRGLGLNLGIRF
ncbi:MAG: DUF3575 domain-containing protein [Chitinophagaceae bacterium]|nr:DUF3575 domain-containing protein [Chitinophagaceae bacterium]